MKLKTYKNFESAAPRIGDYIDIEILSDMLIDIADDTCNSLKYPSNNFREVPFGGGIRFKHWNKKYVSYCLKFDTFISTSYYKLIRHVLEYYYSETGDEIFCFIYSNSTSYIERLYFIRMYVLNDITRLEPTDKILTKDGFYKPPKEIN